jgi:hypothetical protein
MINKRCTSMSFSFPIAPISLFLLPFPKKNNASNLKKWSKLGRTELND